MRRPLAHRSLRVRRLLVSALLSVAVAAPAAAGTEQESPARTRTLGAAWTPANLTATRAPLVALAPFDRSRALAVDAALAPLGGPQRIGEARAVELRPVDGAWLELPGGQARWAVELTSPEAVAMRLRFRDLRLPAGAELVVGAPSVTAARTYRGDGSPRAMLWSPALPGDVARIEYLAPAGQPRTLPFELDRIQHHYLPAAGAGAKDECTPQEARCVIEDATLALASFRLELIVGSDSFLQPAVLLRNASGGPLFVTPARLTDSEVTELIFRPLACGGQQPASEVVSDALHVWAQDTKRGFTAFSPLTGSMPDGATFAIPDPSRTPTFGDLLAFVFSLGEPEVHVAQSVERGGAIRCPAGQSAVSVEGLPGASGGLVVSPAGMFGGLTTTPLTSCQQAACVSPMSTMRKNKTFDKLLTRGLAVLALGGINDCRHGGRLIDRGPHQFVVLGRQTVWASYVAAPEARVRIEVSQPDGSQGLEAALYTRCPPAEPEVAVAEVGATNTLEYENLSSERPQILCLRLTRTSDGWDNPVQVYVEVD